MARITVKGKALCTSHSLVKVAAGFYAERLMGARLASAVSVSIELDPNLQKNSRLLGYCNWLDERPRPREFEIVLDAMCCERRLFQSLAHEMVHVKQYAKGEMKHLMRRPATRWLDQYYEYDCDDDDVEDMSYWDMPWEIEAHGREIGLYQHFLKHRKALGI